MKNLLLLFILICGIPAFGQQNQTNTLWYDDAWIEGELTAKAFRGDIASATVDGEFGNTSLYDILLDLQGRNIATQFVPIANRLFWAREVFGATVTEWQIDFPIGRKLKDDGTFMVWISGAPFHRDIEILPGDGDQDRGFRARLDSGEWGPGQSDSGLAMFEIVDASASVDPVSRAAIPEVVSRVSDPMDRVTRFEFTK